MIRKIFDEIYSRRIERIDTVHKQIDFNNLVYKDKSGNTRDFRSIVNPN